jgi:hypothetical protein
MDEYRYDKVYGDDVKLRVVSKLVFIVCLVNVCVNLGVVSKLTGDMSDKFIMEMIEMVKFLKGYTYNVVDEGVIIKGFRECIKYM